MGEWVSCDYSKKIYCRIVETLEAACCHHGARKEGSIPNCDRDMGVLRYLSSKLK